MQVHPSHETRMSDASTFDEICVNCGATDGYGGTLNEPCTNPKEKPMTEQEWLVSEDPQVMLKFLTNAARERANLVSNRKLRLFSCNCAIVSYGFKHAIDIKKGGGGYGIWYKTGGADPKNIEDDEESPKRVANTWIEPGSIHLGQGIKITQKKKADIFRDIIGNPIKPVTLPTHPSGDMVCIKCSQRWDKGTYLCAHCYGSVRPVCDWITPDVLSLANAAYDEIEQKCIVCNGTAQVENIIHQKAIHFDVPDYFIPRKVIRTPCPHCDGIGVMINGTLDPERFSILADAVEEAGCVGATCPKCNGKKKVAIVSGLPATDLPDEPGLPPRMRMSCPGCSGNGRLPHPLLTHLRSPGPHYRGCWALDLLLGYS